MPDKNVDIHVKGHDEASAEVGRVGAALDKLRGHATGVSGAMSKLGSKQTGTLGGALSGMLSFVSPLGAIASGTAIVTGAIGGLTEEYNKDKAAEDALAIAARAHHVSLTALQDSISKNADAYAKLGFEQDNVRDATTKLVEAGLKQNQITEAMPHIMDLARAKHIDLTTATALYTRGIIGNVRALAEYGIKIPAATKATADMTRAQKEVTSAGDALSKAHLHLSDVQQALAGKTHLTTSEQHQLRDAHTAVEAATEKSKLAHEHLTVAQKEAGGEGARLTLINKALQGAIGGQRNAVPPLAEAQARLANIWSNLAQKIGPVLIQALTVIATGLGYVLEAVGPVADVIGTVLGPAITVLIEVVKIWATVLDHTLIPVIKFVISVLGNLAGFVRDKVGPPISAVVDGIGKAFQTMGDIISGVWDGILQAIGSVVSTIIGIIKNVVHVAASIPGPWQQGAKDMEAALGQMQVSVSNWGRHTVATTARTGVDASAAFEHGIGANRRAVAAAAADLAAQTARNLDVKNAAYLWGQHLSQNFAAGIGSMSGAVSKAAWLIAQQVSGKLAFSSPPRDGPLSTIRDWPGHMIDVYLSELGKHRTRVGAALSDVFGGTPGGGSGVVGAAPGGARGGGGPFVFAPNFSSLLPYTPGQGQVLARAMTPELVRELRRQGFIT